MSSRVSPSIPVAAFVCCAWVAAVGCTRANPDFQPATVVDAAADTQAPVDAPAPGGERDGAPSALGDTGDLAADLAVDLPGDLPTDVTVDLASDLRADLALGDAIDTSGAPRDALPSALVAWWRLDETSGAIAYDSSGNQLHGTLESFPAIGTWVTTSRGGGLNIPPGIPSVGVRVGALNAVPPLIRDLRHFTLAAWTRRNAAVSTRHMGVISWQSAQLDDKDIFNLTFAGPRLLLYTQSERVGESVVVDAPLAVAATGGDWVHVAATYDGQHLRVYVEGVLAAPPVPYTRALTPSPYPLFVGTNKNPRGGDQPFEGVLDEVMLFSEALDADAIARVRAGALP